MKAEVVGNKSISRVKISHGEYNLFIGNYFEGDKADEVAELFNQYLSSHVQSELSNKIAEIEKTFTDEHIIVWSEIKAISEHGSTVWADAIETGMKAMRSEILKRLKGE
jgi:hypothetical protein